MVCKNVFKTKEKAFYLIDEEVLVCGTETAQLPFFHI